MTAELLASLALLSTTAWACAYAAGSHRAAKAAAWLCAPLLGDQGQDGDRSNRS